MSYSLESLYAAFGGHSALAQRLIKAFQAEAPGLLSKLSVAVAGGQAEEISRAAHTLKGAVSNYRYSDLVDLLESMEQRAAEGSLEGHGQDLPRVETMIEDMLEQMRGVEHTS